MRRDNWDSPFSGDTEFTPTTNTARQDIERYLFTLCTEEYYDSSEGVWYFRSGGQCSVCTDSAAKIAARFSGMIYGFYGEDNRTSMIAEAGIHGHDFAIIDRRWLVDYWAFRVEKLIPKPMYDYFSQYERHQLVKIYGPPSGWTNVPITRELTRAKAS